VQGSELLAHALTCPRDGYVEIPAVVFGQVVAWLLVVAVVELALAIEDAVKRHRRRAST
jgi:hypothetical protein